MNRELSNPPAKPVTWYVFERISGRLLGVADAMRAYDAWEHVRPGIGFGSCWVVHRTANFQRHFARERERVTRELNVAVDARDWPACTALEAEDGET